MIMEAGNVIARRASAIINRSKNGLKSRRLRNDLVNKLDAIIKRGPLNMANKLFHSGCSG
jgi:hypothetical protein